MRGRRAPRALARRSRDDLNIRASARGCSFLARRPHRARSSRPASFVTVRADGSLTLSQGLGWQPTKDISLVLWDIDQTLIDGGDVTHRAYAAAFHTTTGRTLKQPWQFDGRTEPVLVRRRPTTSTSASAPTAAMPTNAPTFPALALQRSARVLGRHYTGAEHRHHRRHTP